MSKQSFDISQAATPNLARRLAVIFYDLFLLAAVILAAVAIITMPLGMIFDQHLNGQHPLFQLYVLLIIVWFYAYFWVKGGQTLGMRAWRIKVVNQQGGNINLKQAIMRILISWLSTASFGFGFLASLWDKDNHTWHDTLSHTYLVMLEKDETK